MSTILLATDLDDTLVGNTSSLHRFNQLVSELRSRQQVKLVYVTGRSPESYDELRFQHELLQPDALIAAVGTEIYTGNREKCSDWPESTGWDPNTIKALLADIPSLQLQPKIGQREYKLGYFLKENNDSLHEIKEILKESPVDVIYCQGLYLDILPKGAHKGGAVRFLADLWGVALESVIACGDSGNDISMLEENKAIIVGNAKAELLDWMHISNPTNVYKARARYADGIIEGLKQYRVI